MKKNKLLTTLAIIMVVLLAGCKKDDYVETIGVCPLVISTDPANAATNVPVSKTITATFNEKMDSTTITGTTFTIKAATVIAGTISYSGTTATFKPSSPLAENTTYTGRISTTVKDLKGNALQADYVWTFSTGAILAPAVVLTDPVNLATNVPLNKVVTAKFNMPMDPSTITNSTIIVKQGTTTISGAVSFSDSTASFTPDVAFLPGTVYTATITTGTKNVSGKALPNNYTWTFTTLNVYTLNVTAPNGSVVNNPNTATYNSGTSVQLTATPNSGYTFSSWSGDATGTTNPLTVNMNANKNITANFILTGSGFSLNVTAVNGSVSKNPNQLSYISGTNVILTPTPNPGYVFSSWSGDATGSVNLLTVNMNANKNITANFTALAGVGPGVINLGGAAIYTILSKTGISTTVGSSVTGNIGVSPNAAIGITGFGLIMDATNTFSTSSPSTLVSGKIYAADYAAPTPANISTAVSDMETAFTTANGLTTTVITELGAGDITGMTLVPGLYKWSTGLLISASGVTLTGNANDTWVFQIGQGMTVANGAIIHLAGGAQAKNIFWITASDAVIGSTANFSGNILSQTLISLNTGSAVTGRLLGQTAVTLNDATVIIP